MRDVYIKPRSPHLNGKVERCHATDAQEFYQLIDSTDDIDIGQRLEQTHTNKGNTAWPDFSTKT